MTIPASITTVSALSPSAVDGRLALPTPLSVRRIERDNYRTITLELDGCLSARPGQFVMASLPRFDEKPFSLVNNSPVTLMVTAVGHFSGLIHELTVGQPLWIRGPFGRGFTVTEGVARPALVGGGYGVAPLFWLARTLLGQTDQIHAIVGARTADDVLYGDRFVELAEQAAEQGTALSLLVTTEDGSQGLAGRVTSGLEPLLATAGADAVFACGPHGMLAAIEALAAEHQCPSQLSWEAYMRCGVGICGSCEHRGLLLCLDGPVLEGRTA